MHRTSPQKPSCASAIWPSAWATPNLGARSLRSQETKLLGLVIPATTDPIFARIVMAIEQRALEHGYELILHHSWNQPEREETILQNLISRRVDGIFLSPVYRVEPEVDAYRELSGSAASRPSSWGLWLSSAPISSTCRHLAMSRPSV